MGGAASVCECCEEYMIPSEVITFPIEYYAKGYRVCERCFHEYFDNSDDDKVKPNEKWKAIEQEKLNRKINALKQFF